MRAFLIGLQFLTRLPVPMQPNWTEKDFGESVKWFPVIGMVIGVILCGIYFLMAPLGVPYLTAFVLAAGELIITGATLADGLMDSSDGLFSGRSRERMLEIMKDSSVGAFGLLALLFIFFLKIFSLAALEGAAMYTILLAMPVIGRMTIVISICEFPYARPYGLGKSFASYRDAHAVAIAFVTALLPAAYFGTVYLILLGAGVLLALLLNSWVTGKIGGTTGDTYGFVDEVAEAVLAFLMVILIRGFV